LPHTAWQITGVQFDQDGNAVNPKINYGGEAPAPAAAAAQTPRPRGGPMARQTAPVDIAKARSEANAAITDGADRAAVAARFKQQTGQDF
jgi:hypothetical protein